MKKLLVCTSMVFSLSNAIAQNRVGSGGVSGTKGGIKGDVNGGVSGGGRCILSGTEGGNNVVASIPMMSKLHSDLPTRFMQHFN